MKRIFFIVTLFFSLCASAQIDKISSSRPNPPKLVNDYTGTLTEAQRIGLENKLVAFDDSTSNQIAVVIIQSLEGKSIEDVALEILTKWGIGNKDKNNGVLLLIAINDHKIRIETGYGLEGAIPDLTAKSIIDNDLTPNFKKGNYYQGIDLATDDLIKAAAGSYTAPPGYSKKKRKFPLGWIFWIIVILIAIFSPKNNNRGGGMVSRRGYGGFGTGWLLGSLMGGGSSGGGWSGGGGGGGFGGFGGGGGGGGGASGGW